MPSQTEEWTPAKSVSTRLQQNLDNTSTLRQTGMSVEKVTTRGRFKPRFITISADGLALFCTHGSLAKKASDTTKKDDTPPVPSSFFASRLPLPMISRKGIAGWTGDLRQQYVRYVDVADLDSVCTSVVTSRKLESTRKYSGKVDTQAQQIVTIGHHGDQTLDVMVAGDEEREWVVKTIQDMIDTYHEAALLCGHEALLLRYIWYDVDSNRDGTTCQKEFLQILNRINLCISNPKRVFLDYCKELSVKPSKGLQLEQTIALLQRIKREQGNAVLMMWIRMFGSETKTVTAPVLLDKFLRKTQMESSATLADAQAIIAKVNRMDIESHNMETKNANDEPDPYITFVQFEAFLYHEANAAYNPEALLPSGPLTEPMSKYFINTSHNTYLTGDQLQSFSSVEMYDRALRRGCKCLELDCWDGDVKATANNTEILKPVVFHGHTLTSKIHFGDILQVVNNYLKENPKTYPIILSLENHCSFPYQEAMAKLLTDTFGGKLYVPESKMIGPDEMLPSPESLRGLVVIKGKRPPEPDDAEEDDYDPYNENEDGGDNISRSKSNASSKATPAPAKPPKVVKSLARLTLFHGTKYKAFEDSLLVPSSHMHSINELKIYKILSKKANGQLWRAYNVDHMTRTYPAGTRVDSSNYNPLLAWSMGCQLVALNFQTPDAPLIVNDGFFRQKGGCGYLLKPRTVLEGGSSSVRPVLQVGIRVMCGTCLPKPKGAKSGEYIDPYVEVSLHDVKGLSAVQSSFSTGVVTDNGFCPVWKDGAFEFVVYTTDLAVVRFGLREADIALDEDVAYAAIPVEHLRTGYRSVQLYDRNNTRTGPFRCASLLVEITTTKTITATFPVDAQQDQSTSSRHA